jgi:uncharacterized membrane protein
MSLSTAKLAVIAAVAVAGAVGGYVAIAVAPLSPWTMLAMLGPMAVVTAAWLWSGGRRVAAVVVSMLFALAFWASWTGRVGPQALYMAQHAGIHAALGAWFASTLKTQPLIVRVARRVHHLTPPMVAYATSVTRAWALYFVVMALASPALFALAPFTTWNAFATIFTPLSVVAMFVGEYRLRYALHPEFERVSMRDAVRAWREPSRLPDEGAR